MTLTGLTCSRPDESSNSTSGTTESLPLSLASSSFRCDWADDSDWLRAMGKFGNEGGHEHQGPVEMMTRGRCVPLIVYGLRLLDFVLVLAAKRGGVWWYDRCPHGDADISGDGRAEGPPSAALTIRGCCRARSRAPAWPTSKIFGTRASTHRPRRRSPA